MRVRCTMSSPITYSNTTPTKSTTASPRSWRCSVANERNARLDTDADPVLSDLEAAAYLKTTRRKLRRLRSEGKIRFSRVGFSPTYRRSYLDEYLKQQEVRPTRRA